MLQHISLCFPFPFASRTPVIPTHLHTPTYTPKVCFTTNTHPAGYHAHESCWKIDSPVSLEFKLLKDKLCCCGPADTFPRRKRMSSKSIPISTLAASSTITTATATAAAAAAAASATITITPMITHFHSWYSPHITQCEYEHRMELVIYGIY